MQHPFRPPAPGLAALLAVLAATAPTAAAQTGLTADSTALAYVREVLAANPGLRSRWRLVEAAGRAIPAAGALPDPMVSVGVMALPTPSFAFAAEPMTQVPLAVEQRFPGFGKRRAETEAAAADSAAMDAAARAGDAELAAEALIRFTRLAERRTALALWDRRMALAEVAAAAAEARYAAGAVPQTDVLRARMRRAQLAEERHALAAEVHGALAAANAVRASTDSLTTPELDLDAPAAMLTGPLPPADSFASLLRVGHPALRAAGADVSHAERIARVRGIAARPDFVVSVQEGVRFGGQEPFLTAMVGVSIPLWQGRKQRPLAEAADLAVEGARNRLADLEARLGGEALGLLASWQALGRRVEALQREVMPLADAASTSALQQYRAGTVDLSTVLDAQDDAWRARLQLAGLVTDLTAGRTRLALMLGEEWYR